MDFNAIPDLKSMSARERGIFLEIFELLINEGESEEEAFRAAYLSLFA